MVRRPDSRSSTRSSIAAICATTASPMRRVPSCAGGWDGSPTRGCHSSAHWRLPDRNQSGGSSRKEKITCRWVRGDVCQRQRRGKGMKDLCLVYLEEAKTNARGGGG